MAHIPAAAGTYYLHLILTESIDLQVGQLGCFHFEAGSYFYCGSAFGTGGLHARLNRHLAGKSKLHWHIDWLRRAARVAGWGYQIGLPDLECEWSQDLASLPGAQISVPGFGASDCRNECRAHLIYFRGEDEPNLENRVKWGNVNVWRNS
jgi:Uri superfamily endonuclease